MKDLHLVECLLSVEDITLPFRVPHNCSLFLLRRLVMRCTSLLFTPQPGTVMNILTTLPNGRLAPIRDIDTLTAVLSSTTPNLVVRFHPYKPRLPSPPQSDKLAISPSGLA
mmetsp:Transcript_5192/g.13011  ORF Transcript_5192/g.13011 Transcript_5192/m.13011 type:complete len:111 (-) Transcript_5192:215-547(-)